MANHLITLLQALQLVALGPCIFVIFFLFLTARRPSRVIIPALYFIGLCCSFSLPLLPLLGIAPLHFGYALLQFGESLIPAFCYLLILQFIYGRPPKAWYWLILALPVLGGTPFIYIGQHYQEFCLRDDYCFEAESLKRLYAIFSASMIFLLLLAHYSSHGGEELQKDPERSSKFWLIMALIMLSLQLMVVDLAALAGMVGEENAVMISTLIRIAFIFLVLTSLFKVFGTTLELAEERIPTLLTAGRSSVDTAPLIARLELAMTEQRLYREMGMNREVLANKVAIQEQLLSRIINEHFQKNFNEFINGFRVEEAKSRLKSEDTAITTIAFEVGFNSIASFNRVFRNLTGQSPSAYRAQSQQGRA